MKVGDLVSFVNAKLHYPQYVSKFGLLVEERDVGRWIVSVNGKLHPFLVLYTCLEVVNASR